MYDVAHDDDDDDDYDEVRGHATGCRSDEIQLTFDDIIYGKTEVCTGVSILGVNECDRAIDYLRTPGVLSIADVDLLHTRATQSLTYSDTCGDGTSSGEEATVTVWVGDCGTTLPGLVGSFC